MFYMNNMMKLYVIVLIGMLFFTASGFAQEKTSVAEEKAVVSAKAWLDSVDSGKYAGSWDTAADYFKTMVTKEKWEATLNAVRTPLGTVVSRVVKTQKYTTSLPGALDGEYVVILFATSFENKKTAIETVTPMRQEDGTWKVSGYFIK